ncbi:nuclear transport factor 2 family protein [Tsukamurella sp. 1534]|uniref:nuclear transport factor 2 family protein n=1 Tax=Tsukamurella sp. 1534 TaxID=1151061 RepID=UPI000594DC1D|nr:nuclear transport factor 2 family protein [Tsukamurella sp. 1534]
MQEFRAAVEAGDHEAMERALADDVVLHGPVAITPYEGRATVAAILRAARRVMGPEFRYVREITDPGGRDHALIFTATLAGKRINGCDLLHLDEAGKIDEFTVMVRPLSGVQALNEAMGSQFGRIVGEANAANPPGDA